MQFQYRIEEMDCPTEEGMIRKKLGKIPEIENLEFNLMQRVLTVTHTGLESKRIEKAIRSVGFTPVPVESYVEPTAAVASTGGCCCSQNHGNSNRGGSCPSKESAGDEAIDSKGRAFWKTWGIIVIAGSIALFSELTEVFEVGIPWIPAILALTAVLLSGLRTYKMGWISILQRNLNINALMSIAVTGAMIIGVWPEAAMVMVLFSLAEKLEALSLDRARHAIQGLMELAPDRATVQLEDGSWQEVEARLVEVGALIRVQPGGRVSHDGEIVQGYTSIDQSAITGESIPVEKQEGDSVFAGTVNQQGEVVVRVTAEASRSTLSRIIHLVEEAQSHKSETQRFVDAFAKVYTPIVILAAIGVAIIPPLFFQGVWLEWVYRALALLIIGCPCALVVSTPVTIVSGLARASRMGLIVKGGIFLEQAAQLNWVALDKTGTITRGVPVVTDTYQFTENSQSYRIGASLANSSNHPISRAVAERYRAEHGDSFFNIQNFQAIPGQGTSGIIDGEQYYFGSHRLMRNLNLSNQELEERLELVEAAGKSVTILASTREVLLLFAVADTIKESSKEAIQALHALGVQTIMLSGDNQRTANAISRSAGIDDARGNLMPQDKSDLIQELAKGQVVAMVGDGINDAPALAYAHVGIAMGGIGTDTAIEAADVVVMDDDLRKIPRLITLSRRTRRLLGQNIGIALVIKALFFALTVVGIGTMWMAVFADMGASLIVVFNGLRLLKD